MGNSKDEFKPEIYSPPPLNAGKVENISKQPTSQAALLCARAPFAILAVLALLRVIVMMSPELQQFKAWTELTNQAMPLEVEIPLGSVISQGNAPILWAGLAAGAFSVLSYTPLRSRRLAVWPLGLVLMIFTVTSVYGPIVSGMRTVTGAIVLTAVICGCTLAAMNRLPGTSTVLDHTNRGGGTWLVIFLVSVLGPMAVGRALLGGQPTFAGSQLTEANFAEPTGIILVYSVGASLGFLIWAVWQLLPPYKGRRIVFPLVMFVAAGFGGLGILVSIGKDFLIS